MCKRIMKLVGRKKEIGELEDLYRSGQAELVSATGITQTTLSHWERAYKLPDSAKPFLLMSMALGVSVDCLFYNDDMPSALSANEKKTLEEAAEILGRVYAKK